MKINLGSIQLPINSATKTFAILAKRGAGKSYTGAIMAEEFFKNGIPFVVFDPIDVWWGLRLDKNGKDKGLPVVVFGLEHADIKLDRDMGRRIAQAVVKENVSCIISTFWMPKAGQRHLITEFAEEILNINNIPRHIFIEEAHEFVPQRVFGSLGKCFNAVSNLVVMGRNRGLGVTLINQRAATVNKDVLTQIDTLLAFRNIAPQDRQALKLWVEAHSAEGDFEKFMASLPSLPTGEGWIWSPEFLSVFERIKIRHRETFHPDREKIGDKFVMPHLEQADIQSFISDFSASLKEEKKASSERRESKGKGKATEITEEPRKQESLEVINLRNEYESRLMGKDMEIRKLQAKLDQIAKIAGDVQIQTPIGAHRQIDSNVEMWLEKLGNDGSSRMLKFLAGKAPMKFTRSQLGLAVGISPRSGSFRTYLSRLRRNHLIIVQGDEIWVNPDL